MKGVDNLRSQIFRVILSQETVNLQQIVRIGRERMPSINGTSPKFKRKISLPSAEIDRRGKGSGKRREGTNLGLC